MSQSSSPLPVVPAAERAVDPRRDLLGLTRPRLAEALAEVIDRPFRVEQVYKGLYERGVASFDEMTDLARPLRGALAERFRIGIPEIATRAAAADGTTKYLLRLADGATIEAVDIPTPGRRTLCLSSQAGCALACAFCVTGYWGAGRNLTAGEIVGQVLAIQRTRREDAQPLPPGLNLVFMGMGEPLHNLPALADALAILTESISWRRITVSTAGVIPGIEAIAAWPKRPNLAVSLHAPDAARRLRIMPLERTHALPELMATLHRFPLEPGRRITFEYILIRDLNDALADADAVARLVRGIPCKVNLIPLNPDPVLGEAMAPPAAEVVDRFRDRLESRGVLTTIRSQRGDEVSAACGQLRAFGREPRTFRGRNL